ncbi:iron/zinc purple acid phosphatase-like protein, partial [Dinothrombium tinctorium]
MAVTWVTLCRSETTFVEYGEKNLTTIEKGYQTEFVDGGKEKRPIFIHRAILKSLKTGHTYNYRCGNDDIWSKMYSFKTIESGEDWSPRFALYGDLGTMAEGGKSIPTLIDHVKANKYDIVFHIGDIAYDLDSSNGRVGDQFMREIEPIAANVPYMVCVGNHEYRYNFSHYNNRFTMINEDDGAINNFFYSFNIGPAHIISFSTEFHYFTQYGVTQIAKQYQWLEKDLKKANKPENRDKTPWIITFGHKPLICSNDNDDDCTKRNNRLRKGMPNTQLFGFEDLFYQYGVDISFWGHQHSYERLWPFYDFKIYNGSFEEPYKNPMAPVHIITGYAGCHSICTFNNSKPEWSAFRLSDYGFTQMNILNKTHIHIEQYSVTRNKTFDELMIVKEFHG